VICVQVGKGFVILGAPLSGKTTLADNLHKTDSSIIKYDSGDEFRDWTANTPEGRLVAEQIARGEYGPDEAAMQLYQKRRCQLTRDGIYLPEQQDIAHVGLPRTKIQAAALDKQVRIYHLIYLAIPKCQLLGRLEGRNKQRLEQGLEIRLDDKPEVVEVRIDKFYDKTEFLKSYYGKEKATIIDDPLLGPADLAQVVYEIISEKRYQDYKIQHERK
jgi:adenylate kinase family enzyme